MRKVKFVLTLNIVLLIATTCGAQSVSHIQTDFEKLCGTWQGSLTYLDYSSGKPYTMLANIEIIGLKNTNKFLFSNIYPDETGANSIDTISVSTDGKFIDKETVKSRIKLPNGNIQIITEEPGKDGNDNKPATLRHTYTFGPTTFINRKDVKFDGETNWINRNEYSYVRKSGRE